MAPTSKGLVYECQLPLQVLYNRKIERIRVSEYEKHWAPRAIHFEISDSLSGQKTKKMIKIEPENAEKAHYFDIDFSNAQDNPKCFET